MFPVEDKVYAGPSIAVGEEHAFKKHNINKKNVFFLLIIVVKNLILFEIQLKVVFNCWLKSLIFIDKFN